MNDIIVAKGITKSYRDSQVLRGIDLTVEKGDFLSIMGESGSGKSTFLSILGGILKPDEGSVTLDGISVTHANDTQLSLLRRTKLGFVFQSLNLIPTLNARDNILLPIYLNRSKVADFEESLRELTNILSIEKLMSEFPENMSGGEAQRVAIARAMLHKPSVLMLDEPTGSLDSKNAIALLETLSLLNREKNLTVVQVTHSKRASLYGNRTVGICDGELFDI